MIKELFQVIVRETSLNVSMSQIDSVRQKSITKSGCRVYDKGYIGISGTLGEASENTWAQAEANLALQVPYPFEPEKDNVRRRDLRQLTMRDEQFIQAVEDLLSELRTRYPDFIFSNKVSITETETSLRNDAGLDYLDLDKTVTIGLLVKHKDSVNIFDTGVIRLDRTFDKAAVLHDAEEMLSHFNTDAP